MMIRIILIGLLALTGTAQALQPLNPPGLLPTAIARRLLEQDMLTLAGNDDFLAATFLDDQRVRARRRPK